MESETSTPQSADGDLNEQNPQLRIRNERLVRFESRTLRRASVLPHPEPLASCTLRTLVWEQTLLAMDELKRMTRNGAMLLHRDISPEETRDMVPAALQHIHQMFEPVVRPHLAIPFFHTTWDSTRLFHDVGRAMLPGTYELLTFGLQCLDPNFVQVQQWLRGDRVRMNFAESGPFVWNSSQQADEIIETDETLELLFEPSWTAIDLRYIVQRVEEDLGEPTPSLDSYCDTHTELFKSNCSQMSCKKFQTLMDAQTAFGHNLDEFHTDSYSGDFYVITLRFLCRRSLVKLEHVLQYRSIEARLAERYFTAVRLGPQLLTRGVSSAQHLDRATAPSQRYVADSQQNFAAAEHVQRALQPLDITLRNMVSFNALMALSFHGWRLFNGVSTYRRTDDRDADGEVRIRVVNLGSVCSVLWNHAIRTMLMHVIRMRQVNLLRFVTSATWLNDMQTEDTPLPFDIDRVNHTQRLHAHINLSYSRQSNAGFTSPPSQNFDNHIFEFCRRVFESNARLWANITIQIEVACDDEEQTLQQWRDLCMQSLAALWRPDQEHLCWSATVIQHEMSCILQFTFASDKMFSLFLELEQPELLRKIRTEIDSDLRLSFWPAASQASM